MAITRAYMTPPSFRRCETQLVGWLRDCSEKCLNYNEMQLQTDFHEPRKRKGKLESSFESQSWSHFSYSWHGNRNVCGDPTSLKLFKNIEKHRASCFSLVGLDTTDRPRLEHEVHRSMQQSSKPTLQIRPRFWKSMKRSRERSLRSAAHSTDSGELILSSARLSQPATISGFSLLDRMLRVFFRDSFRFSIKIPQDRHQGTV